MLIRHSLLARKARRAAERRSEARRLVWRPEAYQREWEADMDSLVREVARDGGRAVVVLYAGLYHEGMSADDRVAYRHKGVGGRPFDPRMLDELREKHAALRRIARESGALLVDAHGALAGVRGPARAALFEDEMHLTAAGNERVGLLVADAIAADRNGRN